MALKIDSGVQLSTNSGQNTVSIVTQLIAEITPNTSSTGDQKTIQFDIKTSRIDDGTVLYWSNIGTTVAADFTDNTNSGTITLNGNKATLSRMLSTQGLAKSTDTIIIELRSISSTGPIIGTSGSSTVTQVKAVAGETVYTTSGTFTFTVPAGVTSLSMLAVGSGGTSGYNASTSLEPGSGGALRYVNNLTVTPGETFTVTLPTVPVVNSTTRTLTRVVRNTGTVTIIAAESGITGFGAAGGGTAAGGSVLGSTVAGAVIGGGDGGSAGPWQVTNPSATVEYGAGGGGSGGYFGSGGEGSGTKEPVANSIIPWFPSHSFGGGGGGGGLYGGGGGGVGLYGPGPSGNLGTSAGLTKIQSGFSGSGGGGGAIKDGTVQNEWTNAGNYNGNYAHAGANYGGGAGVYRLGSAGTNSGPAGKNAVRIIWGPFDFYGGVTATYKLLPKTETLYAGDEVLINVVTTGVPTGSVLYWTNDGTTNGSDFVDGINSGTVTISNNSGSISRKVSATPDLSGNETIIIKLRSVSTTGTVLATSSTITVVNTIPLILKSTNALEASTSQYTVLKWTNNGTFSISGVSGSMEFEYLIVGGGGAGGGGWYGGAGGGAGGVIYGKFTGNAGTSYTVTVGSGGVYGATGANATSSSIIGSTLSKTALGGSSADYGKAEPGSDLETIIVKYASSGGSGAGASARGTATYTAGSQPTSASGGFGNRGGSAYTISNADPALIHRAYGGGGGAASNGGDAYTTGAGAIQTAWGGNGGNGYQSGISGTNVYYGGGGGGAYEGPSDPFNQPLHDGNEGLGGGSNNYGGGGHGVRTTWQGPGYDGGPGVVYIRYLTSSYTITPNKTQVESTGTVTYNVASRGVSIGSTVYWKNSGTATGNDLVSGIDSGSFTLSNSDGSGSFSITRVQDFNFVIDSQETFNGTTNSISLGPVLFNLGSGDWTIETWYNSSTYTPGAYATIFSKGLISSAQLGAWAFGVKNNTTNAIWFAYYYNSAWVDVSSSTVNINNASWHHLAATRSGTTLKLFVDGTLATTATLPTDHIFGDQLLAANQANLLYKSTRFTSSLSEFVRIPYSTNFDFAAGNYTIEFWMHPTGTPSTETVILCSGPAGSGGANRGWSILLHNGTSTGIYLRQYGITTETSLSSFPGANTWTHVAIVRTTTTIKCYINGVATVSTVSAGTNSQTAVISPDSFFIGGNYNTATTAKFFYNGYISNLRIVKGTALYTSDFTPSTDTQDVVTGTSLLMFSRPTAQLVDFSPSNNGGGLSPNSTAMQQLGIIGYNARNSVYLGGLLQNMRINRSYALYTASFTPITRGSTNTDLTFIPEIRTKADSADASVNLSNILVNGVIVQNTISPFSDANYKSSLFDGASTFITAPLTSATKLGTGFWNMECWIYPTDLTGIHVIASAGTNGVKPEWQLYITNNDTITFKTANNTWATGWQNTYTGTSANMFTVNTWYHIVVCVNNASKLRIYVNGNGKVQSPTGWVALSESNGTYFIGSYFGANVNSNYFKGYISNFRLISGSSSYINDDLVGLTVPTTPLTAVDGTVLLTLQGDTILGSVVATPPTVTFLTTTTVDSNNFYLKGSGGDTIITSGSYKYHQFTNSGTFTTTFGQTSVGKTIEILVVAGGGSGGGNQVWTGGGGAGGVVYHSSYVLSTAGTYDITIGAGGKCPGGSLAGASGLDSTFSFGGTILFRAKGGGGGGIPGVSAAKPGNGNPGGSGSGGGNYYVYNPQGTNSGGASTQASLGVNPSGSVTYGNSGGGGYNFNWTYAGGGGGAGAAGNANYPGVGQYFESFKLFGDPNNLGYFASGGSGAASSTLASPAPARAGGGGGFTAFGTGPSTSAIANTGGGGATGRDGASGVVIIRYRYI